MASEFIYVLGAGLTVLVLGGLLAGFAGDVSPGDGETVEEPVFQESIGTIGEIQASSRTVSFGDLTVEDSSPNTTATTRDAVRVGSNVLGSSTEIIEFNAQRPRKAYISFIPSRSASPEDLVVELNGEEMEVPDYETGERVTLSSDNVEKGSNVVRIAAREPGLAVWKMPAYTLENFEVTVNDRGNSQVLKPFRAYPYEVEGFDRGEIRFSVTEDVVSTEPLRIDINGDTILDRKTIKRPRPYTQTFFSNTTALTAGENVLALRTSGDASYTVDNLELTMQFIAGETRRSVTRNFELSGSDYDSIGEDNGRVHLQVDRVILERPVTVHLNNRSFTRSLTPGTNTFKFGQEAVSEGDNSFRMTTEGSYRLTSVNISIAD